MNWIALRDQIRADLQDTGSTPRWTDDLLFVYSVDAIRDYSMYFPRRLDRVVLTASGSGFGLPVDFVEDILVENPADYTLEKRLERPGSRYLNQSSRPTQYYIDGGVLYINGAPQGDVLLTYSALHAVPSSRSDTTWSSTFPDADIELIRLYVSGKVHAQMRSKQSRLDRFDPGSGRRDDNPLAPESQSLMEEYYRKIAERTAGGVIRLYRAGRMR